MRLLHTPPNNVLQPGNTTPGQFFELLEGMTTGMDDNFNAISLALLDAQEQITQSMVDYMNQIAPIAAAFSEVSAAAISEQVQYYSVVDQIRPIVDSVYESVAPVCKMVDEAQQTFACQSVAPMYQGVEEVLQVFHARMEQLSAGLLATSILLQEAAERDTQLYDQLVQANPLQDYY